MVLKFMYITWLPWFWREADNYLQDRMTSHLRRQYSNNFQTEQYWAFSEFIPFPVLSHISFLFAFFPDAVFCVSVAYFGSVCVCVCVCVRACTCMCIHMHVSFIHIDLQVRNSASKNITSIKILHLLVIISYIRLLVTCVDLKIHLPLTICSICL
jgi:hypothetical protein